MGSAYYGSGMSADSPPGPPADSDEPGSADSGLGVSLDESAVAGLVAPSLA